MTETARYRVAAADVEIGTGDGKTRHVASGRLVPAGVAIPPWMIEQGVVVTADEASIANDEAKAEAADETTPVDAVPIEPTPDPGAEA